MSDINTDQVNDDSILVVDKFQRAGTPGHRLPLIEALATTWQYDAYLTSYQSDKRLKKSFGDSAMLDYAILEWDLAHNPDKAIDRTIWTEAPDLTDFPCPQGWRAAWATPNGVRVLYKLSRLVTPEEHEGLVAKLISDAAMMPNDLGLEVDPACSDWTRLQGAPYTIRKGWSKRSDDFESIANSLLYEESAVLDVDSVAFIPAKRQGFNYTDVDRNAEVPELPFPDPEHIQAIGKKVRGKVMTGFAEPTWCALGNAILDQTAVQAGGRDSAAACGTGKLASAGRRLGIGKLETFATVATCFQQGEVLPPEEPGLLNKAWAFFDRHWENDQAAADEAIAVHEAAVEAAPEVSEEMGLVDLWKKHNDVPQGWGLDQMEQFIILARPSGKGRLVLTETGKYVETDAHDGPALVKIIRDLLPDQYRHLTVRVNPETGEENDRRAADVHGTAGYMTVPGDASSNQWDGTAGLRVHFSASRPTTWSRLYAPLDETLTPTRSTWVEHWFTQALGERGRRSLEHWLSLMLEINSRVLPCLIMSGPAYAGKTQLSKAIQGVFTDSTGKPLSSDAPFINMDYRGTITQARWGDTRFSTPILIQNDLARLRGRQPAAVLEVIRQTTDQHSTKLEKKGSSFVDHVGYPRLIINTNEGDTAAMALAKGCMSADAVEASRERILPLTFSDRSRDILKEFVDEQGMAALSREIRQHILWLVQNQEATVRANDGAWPIKGDRVRIPTDWSELNYKIEEIQGETLEPIAQLLVESIVSAKAEANPSFDDLTRAEAFGAMATTVIQAEKTNGDILYATSNGALEKAFGRLGIDSSRGERRNRIEDMLSIGLIKRDQGRVRPRGCHGVVLEQGENPAKSPKNRKFWSINLEVLRDLRGGLPASIDPGLTATQVPDNLPTEL